MEKKIFPPLFFIFLIIGISSASNIIVPGEELYECPIYKDELAFTLVVASEDYNGRIAVEDRWAAPDITEKNPALYNKTASELGIEIEYEEEFYISERTAHDLIVTIKTSTADMYCGLITFTPIDDSGDVILSRGTWIIIDMKRILLFPLNSSLTNESEIDIQGVSSEKTLEIFINQNPAGTITTEGNNFNASVILSEGNNTIFMKAVGSDLQSNSISVVLDTTPPNVPTISPPHAVVNTSTITISGTAESNSIVRIFVNGTKQKEGAASSSGNFTISDIRLKGGDNPITAIAMDKAGNPSAESEPVHVVYTENSSGNGGSSNETVKTKRIELSANNNPITIPDGGNATCNVTASVFDENNTLLNTTLTINFSIVSGNATFSEIEVETQEGKAETVVESSEEGNVTIKAETSSPDIEGDSLTITFTKSEPVSTSVNETNATAPTSSLTNETIARANETNATTNASESSLKTEGTSGLLVYVVTGVVIVIASLFLYTKFGKGRQNRKEGKGVKPTVEMSSIQKGTRKEWS